MGFTSLTSWEELAIVLLSSHQSFRYNSLPAHSSWELSLWANPLNLQAGNFSPSVGSCVWVEDRDEAWIDGEVVEVNGEDIKVLCTSGKHVYASCFSSKIKTFWWKNSFYLLFCFPNLQKIQVVTKASAVYPKDTEAPASGVDDMTRLAYLHEPGVLQNLHSRYDINEIYVSRFLLISNKYVL